MPIVDYPHNLLRGLSDFWTRFFADADQLDALYRGAAIQIGQAYLDLMSTVLGIALKDAIVFDREYYRLITIREDEVSFALGTTYDDNRWVFPLPDPVVGFAMLDNRVLEPTASLEPDRDFELVDRTVRFRVDPSDALGDGVPLMGYARRALDVAVGGAFADATVSSWLVASGPLKGDTLRLLDVGTNNVQRMRSDHQIVLVRANALFISATTPFSPTTVVPTSFTKYVILRDPASPNVRSESFTTAANTATLAHTRLDEGSVRVYAKAPGGGDVVEGVDYTVNYEHGKVYALTAWLGLTAGAGTFSVDYSWKTEVWPLAGASPRLAPNGSITALDTTTRVLQVALWAPDTLVDRRTLANNFGSFIGRLEPSSEAYRAFLAGVFQLYILGPVLQRIESALNVILGFPVVRDDGEVFQSIDTTDAIVDRLFTLRPTGLTAIYEFPKLTPFRTDLVLGLVLQSFEQLTTVVAVTDYVQTPSWWHGEVIPETLFTSDDGVRPPVYRRIASAAYVEHVVGAVDGPEVGDPGLVVGADETGFVPPDISVGVPHPVFRHRLAFVLMDRYLKFHTFSVKFDAIAVSTAVGSAFSQSLKDLNNLVLSARPSHTYAFTTPVTGFRDEVQVLEEPIDFARKIGSRVYGPDKVVFTDDIITVGAVVWTVGDYFKYELVTASTAFPSVGVAVTLASAPVAPRHGRLVRVYVAGNVGGVALVENVDYSVDYAMRQVTRLTAWAATTVNITFRQLNIGNLADAAIGAGDMPILVNGVDPALVTGAFDAAAAGWDGITTPPTAPRDIGMVERALIVYAH